MGTHPGPQPQVSLTTLVGQVAASEVTFTNPFSESVLVDISLTSDAASAASLTLQRSHLEAVPLGPFASLSLPLCFTPQTLDICHAELRLTVSSSYDAQPLVFVYPVEAAAEVDNHGSTIRLKCKARTRLVETLQLQLSGLSLLSGTETFRVVVATPSGAQESTHPVHASLVRTALQYLAANQHNMPYLRLALGDTVGMPVGNTSGWEGSSLLAH